MKEQYVGDINDFRKYGLLRALSDGGRIKIGVCWMCTSPDGRTDGNKTRYLTQPERWRSYDPELFDLLKSVVGCEGNDRLTRIEASGILPGAVFQNNWLPDDVNARYEFMVATWERLQHTDVVFFDPDNGIEVRSKHKGRKGSSKYLYWDEIAKTYNRGHSVLIYQHFVRERRDEFVARRCARLAECVRPHEVWTFRTPYVLFILALQQEQAESIHQVIHRASAQWNADFLTARRVGTLAI